ncbi:MAG: integrase [Hyphomicrobiales bacterium]|nr:integrase [Hyphomicrobiales bacterium]
MTNNVVARFVGGSPVTVLLRLIVVSFVVGFLLETLGLDPVGLFDEAVRAARHIIEFGLTDVRQVGRILLTGAMVVVPVWLVLRLLDAGRMR